VWLEFLVTTSRGVTDSDSTRASVKIRIANCSHSAVCFFALSHSPATKSSAVYRDGILCLPGRPADRSKGDTPHHSGHNSLYPCQSQN